MTHDNPPRSDQAAHDPLRPSGGYRSLRSFQAATVIYDATVAFTARHVDKRSRTVDQMVQAARSGRQNIAEASRAAAASSQTELRLFSVARASLDELLLDYEDFLRHRGLPRWTKDCPESRQVRERSKAAHRLPAATPDPPAPPDQSDRSDQSDPPDPSALYALYTEWLDSPDPAITANALICLIHQANFLLDRQIAALESSFIRGGGYSEQLAAARLAHRAQTQDTHAPSCPNCGKPMALRTARKGPKAGGQFWGCSAYPNCKGTRKL